MGYASFLVLALAAQVYGTSGECSPTDDSCTHDLEELSTLQTKVQSSASLERIPEDAVLEVVPDAKAHGLKDLSPPDALKNALKGGSKSGTPHTVKEKLKALNEIAGKTSPHEAEHNNDLFTANDMAKVVGEHAEDHGCNGKLCHQGDMEATDLKQLLLFQQMSAAMVERANRSSQSKWVAAGVPWATAAVKYCFAADIDDDIKHLWELATKQVKRALPCMSFENVGNPGGHNSDTADASKECAVAPAIFVQSSSNEGCWSYVGMLTPPIWTSRTEMLKTQLLNLKPVGCALLGTVIHELGHALGMAHEQSRPDRSSYVTIHWENIKAGKENNFAIASGGYVAEAYDYLSLMHYGNDAFSTNGNPTITLVDGAHDNSIGQRVGLSQYDADQLQSMYREVEPSCTASSVDGNQGCEDKDSTCAGIAMCSTQDHMEKCCACGGGTQYQCWSGSTCTSVAALPNSHAACILDKTSLFGGRYACVTQQSCDYAVKIKCKSAPGYYWNYTPRGPYQLPPWGSAICQKTDCTFEEA